MLRHNRSNVHHHTLVILGEKGSVLFLQLAWSFLVQCSIKIKRYRHLPTFMGSGEKNKASARSVTRYFSELDKCLMMDKYKIICHMIRFLSAITAYVKRPLLDFVMILPLVNEHNWKRTHSRGNGETCMSHCLKYIYLNLWENASPLCLSYKIS